jgi:hypothetical protein
MSTNSVNDYTFEESTTTLRNLVEKAGNETRDEALAAKETNETPVSKLTYTAGCGEVTAEYFKSHHRVSR